MKFITLTTDFGLRDWFVGTMKGVMLSIQPRAAIVDISHDIAPGDVRAAAFALAAARPFFPKGTVHVAIVDPGVGSGRHAIAVRTSNAIYVGPDNGVLSFALANEPIAAIRRIENERYLLHPVSRTFHGRDVFSPVAAHLSKGVPLTKLGPAQTDFARLRWPELRIRRGRIEGEIVYVDRFGNAITNVRNELLAGARNASCEVAARLNTRIPVRQFYGGVASHRAVAVPGSSGFLEIAVNGGSAASTLGLSLGSPVAVRWRVNPAD
jgi:S-adenosyl-L-methionine hydrolase (adenosine-forming)